MSRAFTKERDDLPEPLINSHTAGEPVPVTRAGRLLLEAQLGQATDVAERRRLTRLVADLVVVEPPADVSMVAFGATVDVRGSTLGERRYTIVGADEADVAAGRISAASPLGIALLGARVGDIVRWQRPVGDVDVQITAIRYDTWDQR